MNFFVFITRKRKENSTALLKANVKVEICCGNQQCDLLETKKLKRKKIFKTLKVVVLGCGVCPCGWGSVSVL